MQSKGMDILKKPSPYKLFIIFNSFIPYILPACLRPMCTLIRTYLYAESMTIGRYIHINESLT